MRVVLDANIVISAIIFGGKPAVVLGLARSKDIEVFVSEPIIGQIVRALRLKFGWNNWRINNFSVDIQELTTTVFPNININIIKEKDSDNRILECAVEAQADYIVSGDKKHVLSLKEFEGIKIISPKEFLEIFLTNEEK